jgi:hypothetical protein
MDDLFGVTELVKKLEDEERTNSLPTNEKEIGTRGQQIEISEAK